MKTQFADVFLDIGISFFSGFCCISNGEAIIPEMYWFRTLSIVNGNYRLQQLLHIREVYEFQLVVLIIKLKLLVQFDSIYFKYDA